MTRSELECELQRLRAVQGHEDDAQSDLKNASNTSQGTVEAAISKDTSPTPQEAQLRRFLDDFGRLSARYGVWLENAQSGPLLHLGQDVAAGYLAWPSPNTDGTWEVDSYVRGAALSPEGALIGDDHSAEGKVERAKAWREENAQAIQEQSSWLEEAGLPLAAVAPAHGADQKD